MRRTSVAKWSPLLASCLAASCASAPPTGGEQNGISAADRPAAQAATSPSAGPGSHASPSVKRFNKTIIYVKDAYFDPARIQPKRMLVAAVRSIPEVAPQLRVDSPEPDLLRLTSGNESRTFSLAGIDSLWKMSVLFTDIYD